MPEGEKANIIKKNDQTLISTSKDIIAIVPKKLEKELTKSGISSFLLMLLFVFAIIFGSVYFIIVEINRTMTNAESIKMVRDVIPYAEEYFGVSD